MEGTITKSTGSWYTAFTSQGKIIDCKLKGNYKTRGIKSTNPIAVGDRVKFEILKEEGVGLIYEIEERENYIIRKSTKLSKQTHIIAANVDQAMLMVTISKPRTSTGFIDRFLAAAEGYHIPSIIVFNKIDIYTKKEQQKLSKFLDIYKSIGYPCIETSAEDNTNIAQVKEVLKDKKTVIAGHSGVGKSTLINCIDPNLDLKTKEISAFHEKGIHTTTFAEMFPLSEGGFIIDTPGIKEFGVIDFDPHDLSQYFMDMLKYLYDCKFNNCTHVHEPGCAVLEALENGKIHPERYKNYLQILETIKSNHSEY